MEPCSILELSNTVLSLSLALLKFFKAFRDAPREVQEYLIILESIRLVFQDVQEYAEAHLGSSFFEHDGMRLTVVEEVLRDCELEFATQLSYIESKDPTTELSFWHTANRKAKWVFGKETLATLTKKLEKLQALLTLAVTTSTGRNNVVMRDKLQSISLDLQQLTATREAESADRHKFLSILQQFMVVSQRRSENFIQLAAEFNICNDARLNDMSESFRTDFSKELKHIHFATKNPVSELSLDKNSSGGGSCSNTSLIQKQNKVIVGSDNHNLSTGLSTSQPAQEPLLEDPAGLVASKCSTAHIEHVDNAINTLQSLELSDNKLPRNSQIFSKAIQEYSNGYPLTDDLHSIIAGRDIQDAARQAMARLQPRMKSRVETIASGVLGYTGITDVINERNPEAEAMCWGVVGLLTTYNGMYSILESLEEMVEVVAICQREVDLYQDQKIVDQVRAMYNELRDCLVVCTKSFRKRGLPRLQISEKSVTESMVRIQKLSQSVSREVDYRHRLEMREASQRLVEMQVEQRMIFRAVEDQKRLLESLQEERHLMNLTQKQQKTIYILQEILRRMQN